MQRDAWLSRADGLIPLVSTAIIVLAKVIGTDTKEIYAIGKIGNNGCRWHLNHNTYFDIICIESYPSAINSSFAFVEHSICQLAYSSTDAIIGLHNVNVAKRTSPKKCT